MRWLSTMLMSTFFVVAMARAGETPLDVSAATGMVEKADKDAVTVQPRGPGGKFAKKIVLKITGTSKLTIVSKEKRAGKLVPVQREFDAKDLEANQPIAVIYMGGAEPVLLSAVVHRAK